MKTKILFVVFISIISYIVYSQTPTKYAVYENLPECSYDNIVMPVTPEEQAHLVYFDYLNVFDSIFVQNTIGEFSLLNSNGKAIKLLYFENAFNLLDKIGKIWGSNSCGTDSILTQLSRTIPFAYPVNSKIRFFRLVQLGIPCGKWRAPESDDVFNNWWDRARLAIPNSIMDTSVWLIQLVRLSDNSVVYTIDSIAVLPNGNNWIAPFIGFEPEKSTHVVDLPNQYANDSVYLRVEVRRYGPTPFGMKLTTAYVPAIYPLSGVYDYGPNNESHYTVKCKLNFDTLAKMFFARLVDYFHSVKVSNNGVIPESVLMYQYNLFALEDVSKTLADSLSNMFNLSKLPREILFDTSSVSDFNKAKNQKIIVYVPKVVNLGNNNYLVKVKINCRASEATGQLVFSDLNGRLLKEIKSVRLVKGINTIEVPLENINTRLVSILFIPDSNEPLAFSKAVLY